MIHKRANHVVMHLSNMKKKRICTVGLFLEISLHFFVIPSWTNSVHSFFLIAEFYYLFQKPLKRLLFFCKCSGEWEWSVPCSIRIIGQVCWVFSFHSLYMRYRAPLKFVPFVSRLLSVACLSSRHATAPMRVRHTQLFCWNHLCTYKSTSKLWKEKRKSDRYIYIHFQWKEKKIEQASSALF
jgi:hypothetical protein